MPRSTRRRRSSSTSVTATASWGRCSAANISRSACDGYRVSELEDREIYESVENLYVLDRSQRRLFTLANLLPRALAGRMHKWIGDGRYASLFDNIEDTLTVERLHVCGVEAKHAY